MIIIGNKVVNYGYLKNTFTTKINLQTVVTDIDDDGDEYRKTVKYMPNKCLIDNALFNILRKEPYYVSRVVSYIINNLVYGTNTLELKGTLIAEIEHLDNSDVSKALTRLQELEIIKAVADIDYYKDKKVSKKLYTINHNYIFKGNFMKLKKEFKEQEKLLK